MTKRAIVTGSSRGIGRALVECFLSRGYKVLGISRSQLLPSNENHTHLSLDLSQTGFEKKLEKALMGYEEAEEIVLLNNAGRLGEVTYFESSASTDFEKTQYLNFIAPTMLSRMLIQLVKPQGKLNIVNISSGAARSAIDGWSAYSSSKAALDAWTNTVSLEMTLKNKHNVKLLSISPGVVDTQMQKEIRETDPANFSRLDNFISFKKEDQLPSPEFIAALICKISIGEIDAHGPMVNLREYYNL